ncbi:MAG: hypothetical protein WAZ60_17870 [Desulfosalsimonadaceae bacterium]
MPRCAGGAAVQVDGYIGRAEDLGVDFGLGRNKGAMTRHILGEVRGHHQRHPGGIRICQSVAVSIGSLDRRYGPP